MDKPIVYLAGPMTGKPDFNYPAFTAAAKILREKGLHVINPAEGLGGAQDAHRSRYLRMAASQVMNADAVVCLPDWGESPGAVMEVMMAYNMNLPVYDFDAEDPTGLGFRLAQMRVQLEVTMMREEIVPPSFDPALAAAFGQNGGEA